MLFSPPMLHQCHDDRGDSMSMQSSCMSIQRVKALHKLTTFARSKPASLSRSLKEDQLSH